jgi:hypothetical protein
LNAQPLADTFVFRPKDRSPRERGSE